MFKKEKFVYRKKSVIVFKDDAILLSGLQLGWDVGTVSYTHLILFSTVPYDDQGDHRKNINNFL